ncbi:MAG: hypothetical protein HYY40_09070 [Bacteroidetes bacterium]|nr:hypothetical protein [Bacteroidota bacterium]
MNKSILAVITSAMTLWVPSIKAQITITQSDMPALNTKIISAIDTTYTGTIGTAGTNQNWIFNGLQNQKTDTMVFLDPTGTPCAGSFPAATHAAIIEQGYGYFKLTSSSMEILGICGDLMNTGDTITAVISPPQIFLTFPSAYNTIFNGNTEMKMEFLNPGTMIPTLVVDSIRFNEAINYSSNIDGWGQVFIPTGTYNAIRQVYTENKTDSFFVRCKISAPPPSPCTSVGWQFVWDTSFTDISFKWWSDSIDFTALELKATADTTIKEAQYYLSTSISVNDIAAPVSWILLSPNPGRDAIRVFTSEGIGSKIIISDFTGRDIDEMATGKNGAVINTWGYREGLYLCRLVRPDGSTAGQSRFAIIK